ncbi:MAG: 50S ribosomal protein L21 [Gammaproteobacteria bacterium]|jgi:large subunit ribosomal protein L21
MYAVIIAGGKQYTVEKDSCILVEKQDGELGSQLKFTNVLLASNGEKVFIGQPYLQNCTVEAVVEAHGRRKKINILKFKRRKHHMKRMGHRQWFTKVKINNINFGV